MSARTTLTAAIGATAVAVGLLVAGGGAARAEPVTAPAPNTAVTLALVNGWTNSPFGTGTAAISTAAGIATFRGAISTSGTSASPFVLPAAFRPTADVYVGVDMCNATNGRLLLQASGAVIVQPETDFSNAQCFVSLEGVSYAVANGGSRNLALLNGWSGGPFSTRTPAVQAVDGVVHFRGAMSTGGTTPTAFRLPAALRPAQDVYVAADLCGATNGRLSIQTNGTVSVQAAGDFANAACFTSLEGITYTLGATTTYPLTPINGWTASPFATRATTASVVSNVVHLQGSMSTGGTAGVALHLRAALRPNRTVYVPVDLCNGANGRLVVARNGDVTVQAESDFTDAQCFTSLEGVLYRLS